MYLTKLSFVLDDDELYNKSIILEPLPFCPPLPTSLFTRENMDAVDVRNIGLKPDPEFVKTHTSPRTGVQTTYYSNPLIHYLQTKFA